MFPRRRVISLVQLLLLCPALLFMAALLVRLIPPLQSGPARSAQAIITWYAGRIWTLWVLLVGLPLVALGIGGLALLREWRAGSESPRNRHQRSTVVLIAVITLVAGIILAVVAVHVLMN